MAFIGISSLSNAISRVFTRNYDVGDSSVFRDFFAANLNPAGSVSFLFSSAALPEGWLYAEGQTVSKATYPDLFAAIGYSVGGSGDNFKVPDLRDLIPIGAGSVAAMGVQAGAAQVTLAVENMPAHKHAITEATHTHTVSVNGSVPTGLTTAGTANALLRAAAADGDDLTISANGTTAGASTNAATQNAGSGLPFNILPPVIGLRAIIKA